MAAGALLQSRQRHAELEHPLFADAEPGEGDERDVRH